MVENRSETETTNHHYRAATLHSFCFIITVYNSKCMDTPIQYKLESTQRVQTSAEDFTFYSWLSIEIIIRNPGLFLDNPFVISITSVI